MQVKTFLKELKNIEEGADEKTRREIAMLKIRLQRGAMKGKIKDLTYGEREEALSELFEEKGWDPKVTENL